MENNGSAWHRLRNLGGRLRLGGGSLPLALIPLFCLIDWAPVKNSTRTGQMRALVLIAIAVSTKWLKEILGLPLALLFAYGGFMWVMRGMQPHGREHLVMVSAAIIGAWWLSDQKELPKWIVWIGAAQAFFGLCQWVGWNPFYYTQVWALHKPTGSFGQETLLGAFLAAALAPALFTKRWGCAVLIALCALATSSTMTAMASGTVVILWVWSLSPAYAFLLARVALGLGIFFFVLNPWHPFFSPSLRQYLWELGWGAHEARPLFGIGPGGWQDLRVGFRDVGVTYLHSEPLELLVEYGWAGVSLALAALAQLFWNFRLTWHHAMVASLLVNSIGNFPLHLAATGTLFLVGWILSYRHATFKGCGSWHRLL